MDVDHRRGLAEGQRALAAGRWVDARAAFAAALDTAESGPARFGLAMASWWCGRSADGVEHATRAYALFRRAGDAEAAVQAALWLAITYKADFANRAAANGWSRRAERIVASLPDGPLRGWVLIARAYRMADLSTAESLTAAAAELGRVHGDVDLELVGLAQLGLIRVSRGEAEDGFALLDEALAAALGGERSSLDTVVYTCCDMLNACELTSDLERAAQWCRVADDFVARYGCPFLYAECRIFYGSVLVAHGRWGEAERQLAAGIDATADTSPALHARAATRLALLHARRGACEEAERLLAAVDDDSDAEVVLATAALMLARGDAAGASAHLRRRLRGGRLPRRHVDAALELLVDAHLAADEPGEAARAVERLGAAASSARAVAAAVGAAGRVALARGDTVRAVDDLGDAVAEWSQLGFPYELARAHADLGRALVARATDVDVAAGVKHLRRALAGFEEVGAGADADRCAAELRRVGVVARTGAKGVGLLTDRERQVLDLLGAGLSNPEIAARLHVTRKTAAHHVSHILTKLDLRNRAEAAAFAAGQAPHRSSARC
jgi:DNA-binding CsgD family transcriptional regulator